MPIRINGQDYDSTIHDGSTPGNPIGTYHLADNKNIYEIQRRNNFEFVVNDIDGIVKVGLESTYANAQEVIRLSVRNVPIPSFSQNVITIHRGNSALKFAGVPEFDNGTIECNDYIGADTVGVLRSWQHLSYDVYTEKVGVSADYKKDCILVEYSPDYQIVRQWKMCGCWISKLTEDSMDYNENNEHKVSVTIEYDKAMLDVTGLE